MASDAVNKKKDPREWPLKRDWDWSSKTIPLLPGTGGFLLLEQLGTENGLPVWNVRIFVADEQTSPFTWSPPSGAADSWAIVDIPKNTSTSDGGKLAYAWLPDEKDHPALPPVIIHGKP